MRACNNTDALTINLQLAQHRLAKATAAFDEACKRSLFLREAHENTLAEALAIKNKTTKAIELKKISHIKQQKRQAARVKTARKLPGKGLATKLIEKTPEGERVLEEQEELVRASACENCNRFTNCFQCSFLQGQLLADIGILADCPAIGQIMAGTYIPPPACNEYEVLLLQELKMPDAIRENPLPPPKVSTEEHQYGWQRQRESTAGEPTSLDFSLHIAASYDAALADMDATLRSIPLEVGFSPIEWERVTDCSIPKKANVLYVDKMRTICLMDPAFNMNNKFYGRKLMAHKERLGTLADEQSGSRKGRRSAEVALQKVLTMDILRQKRRAGFLCSNDALQCYDRIVHNIAMLSMRSRGLI